MRYIENLKVELARLGPEQRVAFAAACCERLWPLYERCSGYAWCKPDRVRTIIDRIWAHAAGTSLTVAEMSQFDDEIVEAAPDVDDPDFDAVDACSAFSFAVQCCAANESLQKSIGAAMAVIENGGRSSEYADDDPAYWQTSPVLDEIRRQRQWLGLLHEADAVDERIIGTLQSPAQ